MLQRKANREVPRKQNLSPRLIWSLAHQPTWFGGVLAITAGFLLQAAAQPGLTLSDPIVSVLWGVLVFGERVRTGWSDVLAAVSALVLAAAVLVLIRSPLLSGEADDNDDEEGEPAAEQSAARR